MKHKYGVGNITHTYVDAFVTAILIGLFFCMVNVSLLSSHFQWFPLVYCDSEVHTLAAYCVFHVVFY